ncbi:3'-5' exonuclease [Clostridium perfringens]|nr:3'-5' exonuclease [Clostridium perfringens]
MRNVLDSFDIDLWVYKNISLVKKEGLIKYLEYKNIPYKKSDGIKKLVEIIEENGYDSWEFYSIVKKYGLGLYPSELEKVLGINRTIRKKMEEKGIIKVAYYKENRSYGTIIKTPYYDLEHLNTLNEQYIKDWVSNNYRKPTNKMIQGHKKGVETRRKNQKIKELKLIRNRCIELREIFNRFLKNKEKFLILDTETTGVGEEDKIIDIALVDLNGNVVFESLVNPEIPIKSEASKVNGLKNSDLIGSPKFFEIKEELKEVIGDKTLLIYNAEFDSRLLKQSGYEYEVKVNCLMYDYMAYIETDRWISLQNALINEGVETIQDHRAKSDCLCCLELINKVVENSKKEINWFEKEIKELSK